MISKFNCIKEASEKTGISESAIATSAREKKARRGFLWSYTSPISSATYKIKIHRIYYVYNTDGTFYKEFTSKKQLLTTLQLNSDNISRAIKRKSKVGNYYVSYDKHFNINI